MFGLISLIKSLALTLFIVILLQVKIGDDTLEDRAVFWFRSTPLVQPVQVAVDGGARLVRNSISTLADLLKVDLFKDVSERPGTRDLKLRIERSRQYIREQAEKVSQNVSEKVSNKLNNQHNVPKASQRPSDLEKSEASWE